MLRSAKYWYYWNELAERTANYRFRIEDLTNIRDVLSQGLSLSIDLSHLMKVPISINTRNYGKAYHRCEELLLRMRRFHEVNILRKFFRRKLQRQVLSRNDIDKLCSDLASRIQRKAIEYGYDY